MTGFCLLQPIRAAAKTNAMVKNVAECEMSPHYAAVIKTASSFGLGSLRIEETNTRISIYGKSARSVNSVKGRV